MHALFADQSMLHDLLLSVRNNHTTNEKCHWVLEYLVANPRSDQKLKWASDFRWWGCDLMMTLVAFGYRLLCVPPRGLWTVPTNIHCMQQEHGNVAITMCAFGQNCLAARSRALLP
jgi:hypothetical protein